jgi:hypothetical protein
MASKARWFAALALTGGAIWLASGWLSDDAAAPSDVTNRIWIERLPKNQRDMVDHVIMIDHSRGRIGVTGKSSRWRQDIEIFKWRLERERLVQIFPQTKTKVKSTVRAWECDAPRPFELCLDIKSDSGKKRYYSRHDWVIEPGESMADLPDDAPQLRVTLPEPVDE